MQKRKTSLQPKQGLVLVATWLILAVLPWSLLAQVPPGEEEVEVIVTGVGAVIAGDEAKAMDDALANALRNALQQVIGTLVESDVLVQNYQVLEDNIYTRTQGFVKTYEILGRRNPSPNLLELTVRAVVKKSDLRNSLEAIGLLLQRKGKPRLLVLVDEHNMHHHAWYYDLDLNTTATELINVFQGKGFPFVDPDVVSQKLARESVLAALEGDPRTAQAIARESGAEVLIVGKAVAKRASGGARVVQQAGLVSCLATVNLRAIQADDGRILATTSQQATVAHIDELAGGSQALQKAARLAAQDLMDKILEAWRKEVYSQSAVQLRVLNVSSFQELVRFKNQLKYVIRGVDKIYQRQYSGNSALLELEGRLTANGLAEELVVKDLSPYRVEIVSVSPGLVVAKLVQAETRTSQPAQPQEPQQ